MTTKDIMMVLAIVVTTYFAYDYFIAGGRGKYLS